MYLKLDDDGDDKLDRRCSVPGWEGVFAMDPRHPAWRQFIGAFYQNVAQQPQHDGVVIDMVDAYPFCEGGRSDGVPAPIDANTWISAQDEVLALIRERVPSSKWVFANAGHDFPAGSPFPRNVNGYLLENFLGEWGADLEEGLASAQRALVTTAEPHSVVFAVDTDNTGTIHWSRFRTGLAASLLMDNTYFAFDHGSRDHGGVKDWWFPKYYGIALGQPLGPYSVKNGVYRRHFQQGIVLVASSRPTTLSVRTPHTDIATGKTGTEFSVPEGDAGFFVIENFQATAGQSPSP
jgi:hypothetical protein